MDIHEIVKKLVGPIRPLGDTNEDESRLKNAIIITELIDRLIADVARVARTSRDSEDYSISQIGKHCQEFLDELRESL